MANVTIKPGFDRRIYTARALIQDLAFLLSSTFNIRRAFRDENISRAFIERIMTVITAVNGCVYCAWFHARQALESGLSEAEVSNLLKLQFQADASDDEVMALLYAQHYAESDRDPDPEMTRKLFEVYGQDIARHILLFIRMISFGNLYGNTWDAVLSRFKGAPAPGSSLLFELVFFLLNFPVMLPASLIIRNQE